MPDRTITCPCCPSLVPIPLNQFMAPCPDCPTMVYAPKVWEERPFTVADCENQRQVFKKSIEKLEKEHARLKKSVHFQEGDLLFDFYHTRAQEVSKELLRLRDCLGSLDGLENEQKKIEGPSAAEKLAQMEAIIQKLQSELAEQIKENLFLKKQLELKEEEIEDIREKPSVRRQLEAKIQDLETALSHFSSYQGECWEKEVMLNKKIAELEKENQINFNEMKKFERANQELSSIQNKLLREMTEKERAEHERAVVFRELKEKFKILNTTEKGAAMQKEEMLRQELLEAKEKIKELEEFAEDLLGQQDSIVIKIENDKLRVEIAKLEEAQRTNNEDLEAALEGMRQMALKNVACEKNIKKLEAEIVAQAEKLRMIDELAAEVEKKLDLSDLSDSDGLSDWSRLTSPCSGQNSEEGEDEKSEEDSESEENSLESILEMNVPEYEQLRLHESIIDQMKKDSPEENEEFSASWGSGHFDLGKKFN